MSSYSCQNYDNEGGCRRLRRDCVPGQKGCVLRGKVRFAFDPDERARELAQEKERERMGLVFRAVAKREEIE